jgi:hypothetical protein
LLASAATVSADAIFNLASWRATSQWPSLTVPVFTIKNVATTPTIKLVSSTQLETSEIHDARSKDMPEKKLEKNDHIEIPDWFFWLGILTVITAWIIYTWGFFCDIHRKWRTPGDKLQERAP